MIALEKISIIVPVYNSEKQLDKCLLSIVNQTYKNIEIIVVNDGSTDNSKEIINKFYKQYPNIFKIYSWENHGLGATRNKGLELVTGDYIGFVDSDDYIEPNMYKELLKEIKRQDADVAICNIKKFNDLGFCGEITIRSHTNTFSLLNDCEMLNAIDYGPCNKLFKKEVIDDLKFSIKYKYEDLIPVFVAILRAKKVAISRKLLYNYYMNDSGQTLTIDERNLDMYYVLKELLGYCELYRDNFSFWKSLEKFCVYRIYEIFGHLLNTKYNYLLKDYIFNSIELLEKYFGDFSKSIDGNFLKRKILKSKFFCNIFVKFKRRKISE